MLPGNQETDYLFKDATVNDRFATLKEQVEEHDRVLKKSKRVTIHAMAVAGANGFAFAACTNIVVLYARTFDDNTSLISWIVWFSSVSFSILSLILSSLADSIGFDYLLFATFVVGATMESSLFKALVKLSSGITAGVFAESLTFATFNNSSSNTSSDDF